MQEAAKGYDLMVLGASERSFVNDSLFDILIDLVVQDAPCAMLVVKSQQPLPQGKICISYSVIF